MKKLISAILILLLCLGIYSCSQNDAASTATTSTTDNSTASSDNSTASSPVVIIYPYGTTSSDGNYGSSVINTCYGTNSSGYTSAPFYSTSTHDLKDRLPSSKWSNAVYSLQGHKISSSWENLWDGNLDMSLHQAEVMYGDNISTSDYRGFWTGTKSDGTFSGYNCRDWVKGGNSDNATWGIFTAKDNSSWIENGIKGCDYQSTFLCFMYN